MKCPVCTSMSIEKQAKFRAEHICFSNLERVKCIDCGLHFISYACFTRFKQLQRYTMNQHMDSERSEKQRLFLKA